jgi:hypothetical protein
MERGVGKPPFFDGTNYPYLKIRMSVEADVETGGVEAAVEGEVTSSREAP